MGMTISFPPKLNQPLLLSFDPGKTVGWAMTNLPDRDWFQAGEGPVEQVAEITDAALWSLTETARRDTVMLIERFNVAAKPVGSSRTVVVTAESIGVLRHLAYRHGVKVELKLPVTRMIVTIPHLRGLGWYTTSKQHANQAARHLVAWLMVNGYTRVIIEPSHD